MPQDSVAVALVDLRPGAMVSDIVLKEEVPAGHKVAICDIAKGESVIKYGYSIGEATSDMSAGQHVHTHNLRTLLSDNCEYTYNRQSPPKPDETLSDVTFAGYRRSDGRVGTRNEIWIIPTVGCVNRTAEKLAARASETCEGGIDGIFAFTHPYGCSQLGEDHAATRTILSDLAKHPNAGGVLVIGLGCENNTIKEFKKALGDYNQDRVKFLVTQQVEDELESGADIIKSLVSEVRKDHRVECPISDLVVGLKCGGSDGLSGITANPLVGVFCNRLVGAGGTAILTEVPEMFGAETILMNRCSSREIFDQTVELINNFKDYFVRHGQTVYENPSPGNKAGGITTLEEKSLGCVQKGGHAPVEEVLPYGGTVSSNGLVLLDGPGNDIVSTTALTAAGANLIIFTTGRGTPLGAPVPTVKVSSNSDLAGRKPNWIDFDSGTIVEGKLITDLCGDLTGMLMAISSGQPACNEVNEYREIAILKDGVTL